ncbi:acyl-CoA thioesterase [Acinetobacter chinensis]|uniref:Acyl-CoA thioesterase n=1 Tax=Acinetobacter chinensis TaxID=2004650 RepID=A0A3B7LXD0_9GAMM|nr:acyl-CoA thioesterase [Acinetobacter chinensis]AXY56655.1 acyl-CoA thioesterase [Acinetobacter chinensis]
MPHRYKRKIRKLQNSDWSTEQDIFLIENNHLSIEELVKILPFNDEEIVDRKNVLGLIRREISLRKIHDI